MTLDEFIAADAPWPPGAKGFRVGRRGRAVWETAHYPDGCRGHLVCVSRIVQEPEGIFSRTAYYDRDTEISYVY